MFQNDKNHENHKKSEVIEHQHDLEKVISKVKKPKTRKFLNRGRSLDQFESSESELDDFHPRGIAPNKPPRRNIYTTFNSMRFQK